MLLPSQVCCCDDFYRYMTYNMTQILFFCFWLCCNNKSSSCSCISAGGSHILYLMTQARRHEPWPHQLPIKPSPSSPPHTGTHALWWVTTAVAYHVTTLPVGHTCTDLWAITPTTSWSNGGLLNTQSDHYLQLSDVTQPVSVCLLWRRVCSEVLLADCLTLLLVQALDVDISKRKLPLTQQHSSQHLQY